ncbi:MAG: helix-turn-helix domain-containing protein [Desulfovibrio sp.]|nr:helix-turn-helix domain-containing protein [Desulfovibrio sp.]
MNEREAAKFLGLAVKTLQDWRYQMTGPVYLKLNGGRSVRYSLDDLRRFMDSCKVQPRS